MAKTIEALQKEGAQLIENKKKQDEEERSKGKAFKGFFARRKLAGEQAKFETNCLLAEKEFNRLDQIAAYSSKVEPVKYAFYLVVGVLMGIACFLAIVHIFCFLVVGSDPFFNNMLFRMDNSAVAFATIPLLILIGYYLLLAAYQGQLKLGMRFLWI